MSTLPLSFLFAQEGRALYSSIKTTTNKAKGIDYSSFFIMSDLQENVSSLRMLKPGMKVPFEHFKKPYDQSYIIPVTEGDGNLLEKIDFGIS